MPKTTRQTPAQKRVVREIQRWLAVHEYKAAFDFKLHSCGLFDQYRRAIGICRRGVVVSAGGGCVVEHWTDYSARHLRQFLKGAKRVQAQNTLSEEVA